jgi:hypothetical protein
VVETGGFIYPQDAHGPFGLVCVVRVASSLITDALFTYLCTQLCSSYPGTLDDDVWLSRPPPPLTRKREVGVVFCWFCSRPPCHDDHPLSHKRENGHHVTTITPACSHGAVLLSSRTTTSRRHSPLACKREVSVVLCCLHPGRPPRHDDNPHSRANARSGWFFSGRLLDGMTEMERWTRGKTPRRLRVVKTLPHALGVLPSPSPVLPPHLLVPPPSDPRSFLAPSSSSPFFT